MAALGMVLGMLGNGAEYAEGGGGNTNESLKTGAALGMTFGGLAALYEWLFHKPKPDANEQALHNPIDGERL
jgi:hypothetical protein